MALAKLTIKKVNPRDTDPQGFKVLFNPNSYSINKTVTWGQQEPLSATNAPMLTFGGGGSRTLTLELFFDVTLTAGGERPVTDVRTLTNRIVALTRIDQNAQPRPRPPTCEVSWGQQPKDSDFPFVGVVSNLVQRFTLFRNTGEPIRATLTVTFTEFLDPVADRRDTDPELTTRVVKSGDTLSSIAGDVYRDPTRWRAIAEANELDDPRNLAVGATLRIPKLM
ncbi:MAG TPA: LysM peptidoglycan-binding domain-containing protein [Pyrinomonadaceae bacterium]|nr:LysM peptidoglycan-binding domain-containing protein [Pyrinomonadaceae bacterium]